MRVGWKCKCNTRLRDGLTKILHILIAMCGISATLAGFL